MKSLFEQFDRVIVFDTETTGIDFPTCRVIELGAVALDADGEVDAMDALIRLPEGETIPSVVVDLTGITDLQLLSEGVEEQEAVDQFARLFQGAERPLIVAYNAQFDLNFMAKLLPPHGQLELLKRSRFLDALTVYKDRRDYPHKLCNAIEAYHLEEQVVNSHRAVDDARATVAVMDAMEAERDDLLRYIDLFGFHPKYGVSGRRISSVKYVPQGYRRVAPAYEWGETGVKEL